MCARTFSREPLNLARKIWRTGEHHRAPVPNPTSRWASLDCLVNIAITVKMYCVATQTKEKWLLKKGCTIISRRRERGSQERLKEESARRTVSRQRKRKAKFSLISSSRSTMFLSFLLPRENAPCGRGDGRTTSRVEVACE